MSTTRKVNGAQTGLIVAATTASATPRASEPTTAPITLPRPPSTTIDSSRDTRS